MQTTRTTVVFSSRIMISPADKNKLCFFAKPLCNCHQTIIQCFPFQDMGMFLYHLMTLSHGFVSSCGYDSYVLIAFDSFLVSSPSLNLYSLTSSESVFTLRVPSDLISTITHIRFYLDENIILFYMFFIKLMHHRVDDHVCFQF